MVFSAEETARRAEADEYNALGMCLQWCHEKAGIDALYGTAAIAASHVADMQHDRKIRRGGFCFWTGGSRGSGHIAVILGNGLVRSTDADGAGRVGTRTIEWFDMHWPSLTYVGWSDNVNGVTVPGVRGDGFDMADLSDLRQIVREEMSGAFADADRTLLRDTKAAAESAAADAKRVREGSYTRDKKLIELARATLDDVDAIRAKVT